MKEIFDNDLNAIGNLNLEKADFKAIAIEKYLEKSVLAAEPDQIVIDTRLWHAYGFPYGVSGVAPQYIKVISAWDILFL